MLDLAVNHVQKLHERYRMTVNDPKFKYYSRSPAKEYSLQIYNDSYEYVQMVSLIGPKEVGGYFAARLNRITKTAYDLQIMNFYKKNAIFTSDLFSFIVDVILNEYGMERIVFSVIIGNPAESFYDRIVNNYGGKIVGTFTNEIMLPDGKLYDLKYYELYKKEGLCALEDAGVTENTYRYLERRDR